MLGIIEGGKAWDEIDFVLQNGLIDLIRGVVINHSRWQKWHDTSTYALSSD
jgi:hypothetical protein